MTERRKQIKEICAHYDSFYAMTLATAFVSLCDYGDFKKDAEKIIDFIGDAFGLDAEYVSTCKHHILGEMMKIGVAADFHALSAMEYLSDEDIENMPLYEIKANVLEEVIYSDRRGYFNNSKAAHEVKSYMKYESFHHVYERMARFERVKQQAVYGDVNSTRQLGILYALGIGCDIDIGKAEMHLKRCVLWGDTVAPVLLCRLYMLNNDGKKREDMEMLCRLENEYLKDGIVQLPEPDSISEDVEGLYTCVALIRQYLIVQSKIPEIDAAFADVILNPDVSFKSKYRYICRYKEMQWKNKVIPAAKERKAGFIR